MLKLHIIVKNKINSISFNPRNNIAFNPKQSMIDNSMQILSTIYIISYRINILANETNRICIAF